MKHLEPWEADRVGKTIEELSDAYKELRSMYDEVRAENTKLKSEVNPHSELLKTYLEGKMNWGRTNRF